MSKQTQAKKVSIKTQDKTNRSESRKELGKTFKQEAVKEIAKQGVRMIAGKILSNHPEWYTKMNDSLVNLNLSTKQEVIVSSTTGDFGTGTDNSILMPSVCALPMLFTIPNGDYDGWRSGITKLYQQIRAANSGKVNYTKYDLERYVHNTRILHVITAFLSRLYRMTYTFKTTNGRIPELFIQACGLNPDDIMQHTADLYMYTVRFIERVKANFPLNIALYDRTEWIMGNVFADSDSDKPAFFIPTYDMTSTYQNQTHKGGSVIFTSEVGNPLLVRDAFLNTNNGNLMSYEQMVEQFSLIYLLCDDYAPSAIIAGDILKTFGDQAVYQKFDVPEVNASIEAIYDPDLLVQFQNATILDNMWCPNSPEAPAVSDFLLQGATYFARSSLDVNTTLSGETGWCNQTITLKLVPAVFTCKVDANIVNKVTSRIEAPLVNWHANSISSGQAMSATRLVTPCNIDAAGLVTTNQVNTEVVTGAYVLVDDLHGSEDVAYAPLAGIHCQLLTRFEQARNLLIQFLWSTFDYAPRITPLIVQQGTQNDYNVFGLMYDIMDWDVYADPSELQLRSFSSYANQSLLYVDKVQSLRNTKVEYNKRGNS